ncbi:zinc-binding dehydrogenase [Pseudonocardia sp.]|uniref:zinc-binding dehydrogenase n=1 Tax=Pseudonocardia sp. TaxID=60912 RepID=UPI0031FD26EF
MLSASAAGTGVIRTITVRRSREVIAPLAEKAAAGALKIDVNTVLTLVQTTDGLAIIAAGRARGKVVVVISD